MNHRMAVHAASRRRLRTREKKSRAGGVLRRQAPLISGGIGPDRALGIVRSVVALLAQERWPRFQQRREVGAVRRMAIGAVFDRRLMLPEKRAALIGVTLPAGFVDRVRLEQLRSGGAVRIVAVRADHFSGIERVRRNLQGIGPLFLVAGEALLLLRSARQQRVRRRVNRVAAVAGHAVRLMLSAVPARSIGALVAAQALGCARLFIGHGIRALGVDDIGRRATLEIRIAVQMLLALTVA